jgi:hypothetical protein
VPDLDAARRFYVDGLGWKPTLDIPGGIVFIQVGHGLLLALWGAASLEADVRPADPAVPAAGPAPMSLAQVVATEAEVVAVLERAQAAGGTVLKEAQRGDFGGFHGYFADPAGHRWEVATNPGWSVGADGRVTLGPIEDGA